MLRATGIRKRYGDAVALDGADLSAAPGTVHGVLGENGAGKSTLMRILFGLARPDEGVLAIAGAAYAPRSPRDAARRGIGMVHQHFTLVPSLSVRDNCVLAAGAGIGPIDGAAWDRRIAALAARLRWDLDPAVPVERLAVGQRQRVEIAKALLASGTDASGSLAGRLLILDEPTAVLTPPETAELIPALRALAAAGATVLLITHKLPEALLACDAITVLRRGRTVHAGPTAGLDAGRLAELMVGESAGRAARAPRPAAADAPLRLAVDLPGLALEVRAGEVVGIAGVDGNGQRELVRAILGLDQPAGRVETPGVPAAGRLRGPRRLGVVPDDRHHEALVLELPLRDNLALGDHRDPPLARGPWRLPAAWRRHALELVRRFGVRAPGVEVSAAALSGGNQQRAVAARALHRDPALVVAVNPTRGLDVAASADVLDRLAAARDRGAGVLLVHHDLDELLALSDRVLVLYGGRLRDSAWPDCTREAIGRLMLGLEPDA